MMRLENNLPHEIVLEILKRLPVKPLMRFKCVSKLWLCTIEDPNFVAMHLKHSTLGGTNWYILLTDWYFSRDQRSSLYPQKSLTLASQSEIEVPFISPNGYYGVVGSCNGLICFAETNAEDRIQRIFLWNLFTRKHKAILSSLPDYPFVDMYAAHMVLGFGYSDRIDDYKVVRITYFPDKYGRYLGEIDPKVDVYSLCANLWQTVEFNFKCELSHFSRVSFNGNLHWLSMGVDEDRRRSFRSIITFGVAGEVFNEMALPKSCFIGITYNRAYLAELNSSLALLINRRDLIGRSYEKCYIWVMSKYGVPDSWTKLHTLDLNEGVSRFHGFTRSGELLMQTYQHELISWDPSVGLTRLLRKLGRFDLVTMVESLVFP
ncbi:F-box protein CPR1 [Eucalyptus grandis]|uniref:F-box protein CPR1 n=1 Tax=Eucalyptus grandis TaxID=71139 RepID=UPI00192F0D85|nr:F-box protein CPR1 [Eucalyptus grandis]